MRVAVLISGYLRSFSDNLDNLKKTILDKFDVVDIYIHFTKNGDQEDKYLNFNKDLKEISDLLNPRCLLCEENLVFSDKKEINNTLNTWFKYSKLNELKKENEVAGGYKYDLVIKWRPDLNISEDFIFAKLEDSMIHIPYDSKIDKKKLVNINDGYICDIFAYGKSDSMDRYFDVYEHLTKLIEKYGTYVSESLLYYYLVDFRISYILDDIKYTVILSRCNVFAIAGDSGSGKSTLSSILKKYFNNSFLLECDRYHKWERGDENWKSFTHLNPEANFITKMQEDIFDLKIGKKIYQVDYDHKTGKFTDKQEIESVDNMIVCGLHSLYSDHNNVYNLKIFIDTDEDLKKKWKIERDTKYRGYTMEKILEQIESRKKDFDEHILPQKEESDLIVNLIPNDEKISLRLFIRKNFEITSIIDFFKKNNVNIYFNDNDFIFNEIIFSEYKKLDNLFDDFEYDFYDYILYIILNLK